MKKGKIGWAMLLLCLVCSCKKHDKSFGQAEDKDLTVQAILLTDADASHLSFKVRVDIKKEGLSRISTDSYQTKMLYRSDSSFYLNYEAMRIYASLVQPVANGVKDSYEYLVEFESGRTLEDRNIRFVYIDKYLNHNSYKLKMEN